MTTRRCLLWPSLALASLISLGCGGSDLDALCQAQEDCYGGSEQDLEACVIMLEAIADIATELGCSDQFDAYYACLAAESSCHSEPTGQPCTMDDECGAGAGATCAGGTCVIKIHGVDASGAASPCEAEGDAWARCLS